MCSLFLIKCLKLKSWLVGVVKWTPKRHVLWCNRTMCSQFTCQFGFNSQHNEEGMSDRSRRRKSSLWPCITFHLNSQLLNLKGRIMWSAIADKVKQLFSVEQGRVITTLNIIFSVTVSSPQCSLMWYQNTKHPKLLFYQWTSASYRHVEFWESHIQIQDSTKLIYWSIQ